MGFLAELKKLVYDQTQKLGVSVSNIYGAAQPVLEKISSSEQASWLILTVPSRSVTSPDNFYAVYSSLSSAAAQTVSTTTGAFVYQYSGSDTVTVLARGAIELTQARNITLAVQPADEQADVLVQLDGHVVRRGSGGKEIGIHLDPGTHLIEVLAASNVLGIQAPADLRVSAEFERVPTPSWSNVSTGYLDQAQGAAMVRLDWNVNAKAGGWRILRRTLEDLAGTGNFDSLKEYEPGFPTATDTTLRGSTARYVDATGVLQTAANNVLRDAHYINGHRTTLVESQGTNILLQSQTFTVTWGVTAASIIADVDVAPDGTLTADRLVENTANTFHDVNQTGKTITANADIAFSVYAKAGPRSFALLKIQDSTATDSASAYFDLANGVVGNSVQVGTGTVVHKRIEPLANGWYRCILVCNIGNSRTNVTPIIFIAPSNGTSVYVGDGTSYISIWGAQLEDNSSEASSYIVTTTAALTRGTDRWYASWEPLQQAMTIYLRFIDTGFAVNSGSGRLLQISNSSDNSPRVYLSKTTATNLQLLYNNGTASAQVSLTVPWQYGDTVEVRGSINTDGSVTLGYAINGAAEIIAGTSGAPTGGLGSSAWSTPTLIGYGSVPGNFNAGDQAYEAIQLATGVQDISAMRLGEDARIIEVSPADSKTEYTVRVTGTHDSILVGQELFAGHESLGVVLDSSVEGTATYIRLRLPPGRTAPSDYWVGQPVMSGTFTEIQRIGRTQAAGVVTWTDTAVTAGILYDYALQAWGFLDSNTWSALSAIESVRAGDIEAPSSIVFDAGSPTVVDRIVRCRFTTPPESDYAGVRVYYRQELLGTVTSATLNSFTDTSATFGAMDGNWKIRILTGTGRGQERTWIANTGTTISVTPEWLTLPDGTSTYQVFKDTVLKTDYGLPGSADQLEFEPISTDPEAPPQTYQFRTFDTALNEQVDSVSETWIYDPGSDGTWTTPPIVGIRQVPTTHPTLVGQDDFVAPYNDPKNYAVVELSASDVAGRRGGITIQYQRRDDSAPLILPASANPATEGGTPAQLDNPVGTRSRYVAVERTTQDNWIKVFAQDSDGNISDTLTYTVDYDNDPEISAFEGRLDVATVFTSDWNAPGITNLWYGSGTSGTTGVVWVTGAVDDDAQALKYWLEDPTGTDPTAGAPRTLDLTNARAFAFVFSLGDGQRKKLIMQPYSDYVAGPAGKAGTQVEREFSRPARSSVHFENKDSGGNISGKAVKGLFDIQPTPNVQTPVAVGSVLTAHASASTATTLKASSSPSWTTNQWATQSTKKFFVIAMVGSTTQTAIIVANTVDTLTITPSWTTIPHGALFWIVDSATMVRLDESGLFAPYGGMTLDIPNNVYKSSAGVVFFDRKVDDATTIVEYYAAKNKVPDQGVVRVTVDADTIPEFSDVTLVEVTPNNLRLTVVEPDDDVKSWRVYRRKGGWPTADGNLPTPLTSAAFDRQYLHHTDTVQNLTYDSFAGTGQQYVGVVPTNSMNQDGPPIAKTVLISGNLSLPQLANLRVSHPDSGGLAYNRVTWDHPNISDALTTYHVKVYAFRKISATGVTDIAATELTPGGFVRVVTFDSEAGNPLLNTDDSQTIAGQGSWVHALPTNFNLRGTPSTGTAYTWVYTVELYNPSNSLIGTYTIQDTDFYVPPPCTVTTAEADILSDGTQISGFCQSDPRIQVTWTAANADATGYYVNIEFETSPGSWQLIASGLDPAAGEWDHQFSGFVFGGTTEVRDYHYRVYSVVRNTGALSGSKIATTPFSETIDYCGGGGVI